MAQPVFVIGKNRSGTKWLSNIIANHRDVACVQREGAGGIVETGLFSRTPKVFGTLAIEENYLAFLACYSQDNNFRLMGLDKKVLGARKVRDYFEFFRYLMDQYAAKERKPLWLQKSSVDLLGTLYRAYPDARFILVERDVLDNVRSTIALRKRFNQPAGSVLKETASCVVAHKAISRFRGMPNVMCVRFEQLQTDRECVARELCSFLGVGYDEKMLYDRFKKNTSFTGELSREKILSSRDVLLVKSCWRLFAVVPYPVWQTARSVWRFLRDTLKKPERRFVRGSFALAREEFGWDG